MMNIRPSRKAEEEGLEEEEDGQKSLAQLSRLAFAKARSFFERQKNHQAYY